MLSNNETIVDADADSQPDVQEAGATSSVSRSSKQDAAGLVKSRSITAMVGTWRLLTAKPWLTWAALMLITAFIVIPWSQAAIRPDGDCHWWRIQKILSGEAVPKIDGLNRVSPLTVYDPEYSSGITLYCNNTAVNSPVAYLPALAAAAIIAAIKGLESLAIPYSIDVTPTAPTAYMIASVSTAVFSILVTALAIKTAGERFQWAVLATATTPMTWTLFLYPTADAMACSVGLLYVSLVLGSIGRGSPSRLKIPALLALAVVMGQLKSSLCVLALLPFVLVLTGDWKPLAPIASLLTQAASAVSWLVFVKGVPPVYAVWKMPGESGTTAQYDFLVNGYSEAVTGLLRDPMSLISLIVRTTFSYTDDAIRHGQEMSWAAGSATGLFPVIVSIASLIMLVIAAIAWSSTAPSLPVMRSSKTAKWLIAFILLAFTVLTTALMTIASWRGRLDGVQIVGNQSRYYVTVIPLMLALLPSVDWLQANEETIRKMGMTLTIIVYAFSVIALVTAV